jgi:hypothetical protein
MQPPIYAPGFPVLGSEAPVRMRFSLRDIQEETGKLPCAAGLTSAP